MKLLYSCLLVPSICLLSSCSINIAGGNGRPDNPYFITTQPLLIKKIQLPVGSTLTYEKQGFKTGRQSQLMNESKLQGISIPSGQTITWGGVPISTINKFTNSEMRGFSLKAEFKQLAPNQNSGFSKQWQRCGDNLGISIKNTNDWSFNLNNIVDVESCSVLYQRHFQENTEQQKFLNQLYAELLKVGSK
ncbi:hypothetical protein ACG9ZL_00060 [Acinetobacter sp. ULE_I057]|uniref:hypothetical protein n=1 Tax=Acinetobacter sp. ULE_I057 TaxID=3373070 RepID=UPI003AF8C1C6